MKRNSLRVFSRTGTGPQSGIDVFAFSVLGDAEGDGCLSVLPCVVAEYDESVAHGFKVFNGW